MSEILSKPRIWRIKPTTPICAISLDNYFSYAYSNGDVLQYGTCHSFDPNDIPGDEALKNIREAMESLVHAFGRIDLIVVRYPNKNTHTEDRYNNKQHWMDIIKAFCQLHDIGCIFVHDNDLEPQAYTEALNIKQSEASPFKVLSKPAALRAYSLAELIADKGDFEDDFRSPKKLNFTDEGEFMALETLLTEVMEQHFSEKDEITTITVVHHCCKGEAV